MTLHCLNQAEDSAAARRLRKQLKTDDTVLLLGPAVRLAHAEHPLLAKWLADNPTLYALDEDLQAYAVQSVHDRVQRIDYAGWVALTLEHATQLLWR